LKLSIGPLLPDQGKRFAAADLQATGNKYKNHSHFSAAFADIGGHAAENSADFSPAANDKSQGAASPSPLRLAAFEKLPAKQRHT